ncbi:MAG: tetratricopeptide repeat protein [Thermodesulfobacteriota bacterium]|nr:tetratricopeptide repeat protein [Thermodesulfobacteriota bacterium]
MNQEKFLLVSDSDSEMRRLSAILNQLGYRNVYISRGADNAWYIIKTEKISCIVCDYAMEEMSGIAFLKILRTEKKYEDIPVFLSDDAFTRLKVIRAGQAGVTGLLVSPVDTERMEKKVIGALKTIGREPVVQKARETLKKGTDLIKLGRYEEALDIFNSLVNQQENPECYYNIGYIKTVQGKHAEAIDAFRRATQLNGLFAKAYEEMGKVFRALGRPRDAEDCMQQAAEIYLDKDKLSNAEEILNELLDAGYDSLNVFNTLGVIYRKKGEFQSALNHYKKALKVHPNEVYILYNIGRLHLDMKDSSLARDFFQQAVDLDPGFDAAKQVLYAIDQGTI